MTDTERARMAAGQTQTTRPAAAGNPAYQAFLILRSAFTVAPILFGVDKFFHVMVNWDAYLAPRIARLSPLSVHHSMYVVGVIEIVSGILFALWPRLGGPFV